MSDKTEVPWNFLMRETLDAMTDSGILLVTRGKSAKPNAMTIGWGSIGSIWSLPIFTVLVRPSRHTHTLLEENGDFTVNVLPTGMSKAVDLCGTVSGRDRDKFKEGKMTAVAGTQCSAPIIDESLIAFECRTVMKNRVLPDTLDRAIVTAAYGKGDFHTLYYGQILCVRAEKQLLLGRK